MKTFKKVAAIVLAIFMLLSVCGCHKKDEIAVKIGDVEFTSAYYQCALIHADMHARAKVDAAKASETTDTATATDYYAEKIDKKSYTDWVKDTAIKNLRDIAAFKTLCKENKLVLTEDAQNTAKQYASAFWSSFSVLFEPNGVSEATFTKYIEDYAFIGDDSVLQTFISSSLGYSGNLYTSYYENRYFDFVYGASGKKEIKEEDLKSVMNEKFVSVNLISISYDGLEDADKQAKADLVNGWAEALTKKTKTFLQVYNEYLKTQGTDGQEVQEATEEDIQPYILGAEGTEYASERFDEVKALATDEVKVINEDDDAGVSLVVKKDINTDEDIISNDSFKTTLRRTLKGEEFEKDMEAYAKTLKVKEIKSATKQFKVKEIEYPQAQG